MPTFDDLRDCYLLRGIDPDLSLGRRTRIRYAVVGTSVYLTQINENGPEPLEYLEYAKKDISDGDLHGAINALGNAKRAVHLTIRCFLKVLGLEALYGRTKFPRIIELLQQLDAFPTRMITNLNRTRNLVEHEYTEVGLEQAADFVDVTEMFLLLAYPYFKHAVIGAYVGLDDDERCIEWFLDPAKHEIDIYEITSHCSMESQLGEVHYNISTDESDRNLLEVVQISKSNTEEWLPYLDLFVYCTKRTALRLPTDPRGNGMYLTRTHGQFLY